MIDELKKFIKPEAELIAFTNDDIITDSDVDDIGGEDPDNIVGH